MPNKSDYYRRIDPVTLAPKVHNPWRNSMKRNIVANAYDAAATTSYLYGPAFAFSRVDNPDTSYLWSDDDQGIGNTTGAHWFAGNRWDVTPGTRTITELNVWGYGFAAANVTAIYVEVWRADTGMHTLVASSLATETGSGAGATYVTITPSSTLSVTTVAGKTYYVGVRCIRTDAAAAAPGVYATTGYTFAYNNLRFALKAANWNGATVSTTDIPNALYTYNANATGLLMRVAYTSDRLLEQDITTVATGSYFIARATATPYVVKLEGVVVADTKALTCVHEDINGAGDQRIRYTTELDCGNSTPGQNDLIYATATVNLPDITTQEPGSCPQEGCKFDMWWGVRFNNAGREDLYWQNRTGEPAIHAHSVAAGTPTRGALQSSSNPGAFITLSGDFTIDKIRVGTKPLILVGDSQCMNGYYDNVRSPNTDAWGALPTALTKERLWIMHGEAGQYLGPEANTFGLSATTFKSATPGDADGCEMAGTYGLGATWFFAGIGVNDISNLSTASDKDSKQAVAQLMVNLSEILEELANAGEEIVIAGLPPYSDDSPEADQYENRAVRLWNRALLGMALALECVYYNPWPDMVTPGTENDTEPTFNATYTSDGGTHYAAAGGAVVRAKMVSAMENGTIDLRDAWD